MTLPVMGTAPGVTLEEAREPAVALGIALQAPRRAALCFMLCCVVLQGVALQKVYREDRLGLRWAPSTPRKAPRVSTTFRGYCCCAAYAI